jgi:hypothetical protein
VSREFIPQKKQYVSFFQFKLMQCKFVAIARILDGKATLPEGKSKKAIAFLVRPVAFLVGSEKNRVGRDSADIRLV